MAGTPTVILAVGLAGMVMLAGRTPLVSTREPRLVRTPELTTLLARPCRFTSLTARPATTYRIDPGHRLTIEFLWMKRHGHWWIDADALCAAVATAGECYRIWHKRDAVYRFDTLDAAGRITDSEDFRLVVPAPPDG